MAVVCDIRMEGTHVSSVFFFSVQKDKLIIRKFEGTLTRDGWM